MASNGSKSLAISGSPCCEGQEKEMIFTTYWPSDARALILFGLQNESARLHNAERARNTISDVKKTR